MEYKNECEPIMSNDVGMKIEMMNTNDKAVYIVSGPGVSTLVWYGGDNSYNAYDYYRKCTSRIINASKMSKSLKELNECLKVLVKEERYEKDGIC